LVSLLFYFFFSSRRRHTSFSRDWSSDVCSSDLAVIDNREHRLRPGMFADVTVLAGHEEPVVAVPKTAISYSLHGDAVFVVEEARSEERRVGKEGRTGGGPGRGCKSSIRRTVG